jgi:soluble lytic murein transglycosylase-like protein
VAPLKLAAALLAAAFATPAAAESVADWRPYVAEASQRFGIPIDWIERVMRAESNGQTILNGRPIRSRAGAIGLMQLMPATWAMLRNLAALGPDPDDPRDNILAGTLYLRMMYDRFGYPGLFAAYNAGPNRFAAHLATGVGLPAETIAYVQKVAAATASPKRSASRPLGLFAVNESAGRNEPEAALGQAPAGLFAIQKNPR